MSKETNGVEETCDNCGGKDCERQIEYGEKQPCWIPIKPKDTSSAIKERIKQDLKAEQAYMDTKPCATCSGLVPSNWQPNNSLISEKELNVGIKEQAPTEIDSFEKWAIEKYGVRIKETDIKWWKEREEIWNTCKEHYEQQIEQLKGEVNKSVEILKSVLNCWNGLGSCEKCSYYKNPSCENKLNDIAEQFLAGK